MILQKSPCTLEREQALSSILSECANRWCRKRFYCGYSVKDGFKVYEPLDSNSRVLVSSSETAFSVDYLYEVTLHILHSNAITIWMIFSLFIVNSILLTMDQYEQHTGVIISFITIKLWILFSFFIFLNIVSHLN